MGTETINPSSMCWFDIVYAYNRENVGFCMPEPDEHGVYPSWNEVLAQMGFEVGGDAFFFIHAENPTRGIILNYGNYLEDRGDGMLRVVGETIGYA